MDKTRRHFNHKIPTIIYRYQESVFELLSKNVPSYELRFTLIMKMFNKYTANGFLQFKSCDIQQFFNQLSNTHIKCKLLIIVVVYLKKRLIINVRYNNSLVHDEQWVFNNNYQSSAIQAPVSVQACTIRSTRHGQLNNTYHLLINGYKQFYFLNKINQKQNSILL